MKIKWMVMVLTILFLSGCHGKIQEEKSIEQTAFPAKYTVPEGWVLSEKYSTDSMIFYVEEGKEKEEMPDNVAVSVGRNKYSLEEHELFRDAIVQQLLMQLQDTGVQLKGDGTYTEQDDMLYTFTIEEENVVTKQYYILKDYGFCLVHVTNFTGAENVYEAAQTIVDSFVWETE